MQNPKIFRKRKGLPWSNYKAITCKISKWQKTRETRKTVWRIQRFPFNQGLYLSTLTHLARPIFLLPAKFLWPKLSYKSDQLEAERIFCAIFLDMLLSLLRSQENIQHFNRFHRRNFTFEKYLFIFLGSKYKFWAESVIFASTKKGKLPQKIAKFCAPKMTHKHFSEQKIFPKRKFSKNKYLLIFPTFYSFQNVGQTRH